MAKAKRATKRTARTAALALGAAGASLAMTGGASATAPANAPSQDDARRIFFFEKEISDVSMATFHVFDRENESPPLKALRLAQGGGGGGLTIGGCAPHGGGGGGLTIGGCAPHGGGGAPHVSGGGGAPHVGGCAGHGCRGCAGHGCRGCGGCGWGGVWLGVACLATVACAGSCWQWDRYLRRWINVCY
jgi:hypothetical protein